MSGSGSVTHWIREVKDGAEGTAQEELWKRYFERLVGLARTKLTGVPRSSEDEEDVALGALDSFFQRVPHGQFPQLKDRHDLWPLLAKITARKAANQRQKLLTQKRGGGHVRGESVFLKPDTSHARGSIEDVAGHEPSPAFAAELSEQCLRLLALLPEEMQLIARRKLEGYSHAEIASEIGKVERTVERKLVHIRAIWANEMQIDGRDQDSK